MSGQFVEPGEGKPVCLGCGTDHNDWVDHKDHLCHDCYVLAMIWHHQRGTDREAQTHDGHVCPGLLNPPAVDQWLQSREHKPEVEEKSVTL